MRTKTLPATKDNLAKLENFPNFHKSGSITGMKRDYYGKNALLVRCGDFIYKVSKEVYDAAI